MNTANIQIEKKQSVSLSFFKGLSFMQKNLIVFIPIAMTLGLIYGYVFETKGLKQFIIPATFLMVYPMMVTLNVKKLFSKGGVRLLTITQIFNFLIIPVIGYLIGLLFFKDNLMIRIGFLLMTLIPTSGMTITWTGIAKGNVNEAIRMTVSGLILGALLTPIYLKFFLGTAIHIPVSKIFTQIVIVVFIPLVLGFATQRFLVKMKGQETFQKQIKAKFPPFSTLGVMVIVFIAMALKSKGIIANPEIIAKLIIPLLLVYGIIFLLSTLTAKFFFNGSDGIAMVYGSAMRNLSIALAIAMTVFKESGTDIALVIALAFIVQVQAAVWYVKFTPKIFKLNKKL